MLNTKSNVHLSSISTLVTTNANADSNRSSRKGKFADGSLLTSKASSDKSSLHEEVVVIKKKNESLKHKVTLRDRPCQNTITNKKQLKIFDDHGNEQIIKPILKKSNLNHRRSIPSFNASPFRAKKTVRFPDTQNNVVTVNGAKFLNVNNQEKEEYENQEGSDFNKLAKMNTNCNDKQLAEVINVESYRNYNIYKIHYRYDHDYKKEEDKKDKTQCKCQCIVF